MTRYGELSDFAFYNCLLELALSGQEEFTLSEKEAIREHTRLDTSQSDLNAAAVSGAALAIRSLILINGAGCVALLAFFSSLDPNVFSLLLGRIPDALWSLGLGVAFAAFSGMAAYIANYSQVAAIANLVRTWEHPFSQETNGATRWKLSAAIFLILGVASSVASLVCFINGIAIMGYGMDQAL